MKAFVFVLTFAIFLVACNTPQPTFVTRPDPATAVAVATSVSNTSTPASTATATAAPTDTPTLTPLPTMTPTSTPEPLNPLQIDYLRDRTFTGSDIKIEQTLQAGSNYSRYIASYQSDGLKI